MSSTEDHAQRVLLEQRDQLGLPVAKELLLACYRIEREHQFDRDADVVMAQLRATVARAVDDEIGPGSTKGTSGRHK